MRKHQSQHMVILRIWNVSFLDSRGTANEIDKAPPGSHSSSWRKAEAEVYFHKATHWVRPITFPGVRQHLRTEPHFTSWAAPLHRLAHCSHSPTGDSTYWTL